METLHVECQMPSFVVVEYFMKHNVNREEGATRGLRDKILMM